MRGDSAFFHQVETALAVIPSVTNTRCNPQTGSILVEYDGDEATVLVAAEAEGLSLAEKSIGFFVAHTMSSGPVLKGPPPSPLDFAALGLLGAGLVQLMRGEVVGSASENLWNAYGLYAVTRNTVPSALLIAFGLFQVARGEVLGSATSLLLYAYSAWRMAQHRPGEDTI